MSYKKVTIIVSGQHGSGSVTIAALIEGYLQTLGLKTTFHDPDISAEIAWEWFDEAEIKAKELADHIELATHTHQQPRTRSCSVSEILETALRLGRPQTEPELLKIQNTEVNFGSPIPDDKPIIFTEKKSSLIQVIPDESVPKGEAVLVSKNSAGEVVDAVRAVNLQTEESYPCPNKCKNGKDLLWCHPGGPGNQPVVDCNVCGGRGRVSAVVLAEWNYWRGNSEGPDAVRAVNLQTEEKQS